MIPSLKVRGCCPAALLLLMSAMPAEAADPPYNGASTRAYPHPAPSPRGKTYPGNTAAGYPNSGYGAPYGSAGSAMPGSPGYGNGMPGTTTPYGPGHAPGSPYGPGTATYPASAPGGYGPGSVPAVQGPAGAYGVPGASGVPGGPQAIYVPPGAMPIPAQGYPAGGVAGAAGSQQPLVLVPTATVPPVHSTSGTPYPGSGSTPSGASGLFSIFSGNEQQGPDWSGFYLGATYAKGKSEIERYWPEVDHWAPAGTSIGQKTDGTIGGMVLGFNQQLGSFVVGVDAAVLANKFSKTERSSAPSTVGSDPVYIGYELKQLYLLTARAGLAIGQFLPYVKAGGAYGEFTTYTHDSDAGGILHWGDTSENQTAFVFGGGIEMLIGQHLTLGIDYTRIDFKPTTHYLATVSGTGIAAPVYASSDVSAKMDLFSARVTLKFPPLQH